MKADCTIGSTIRPKKCRCQHPITAARNFGGNAAALSLTWTITPGTSRSRLPSLTRPSFTAYFFRRDFFPSTFSFQQQQAQQVCDDFPSLLLSSTFKDEHSCRPYLTFTWWFTCLNQTDSLIYNLHNPLISQDHLWWMSANIAIKTDLTPLFASLKLCICHAPCPSTGWNGRISLRALSAPGAALSWKPKG